MITKKNQPPLCGFEDRLLTELRAVVEQRAADGAGPATVPVWRRHPVMLRTATAGAAVSAAIALTAVFTGGAAEAAYAVDQHPDGTVTVTVNELSDPAGLQAKLIAAGVPARVLVTQATCPVGSGGGASLPVQAVVLRPPSRPVPGNIITLKPSAIPAGDVIALELTRPVTAKGVTAVAIEVAVTDKPPTCAVPPDIRIPAGPGGGPGPVSASGKAGYGSGSATVIGRAGSGGEQGSGTGPIAGVAGSGDSAGTGSVIGPGPGSGTVTSPSLASPAPRQ